MKLLGHRCLFSFHGVPHIVPAWQNETRNNCSLPLRRTVQTVPLVYLSVVIFI